MKILLFASLFFIHGCAKNLGSGEGDTFRVIEALDGKVTFLQLQQVILTPKCLRCHDWVADEEEVLKRVTPGSPEESPLFQSVDDGSMPKGGPELSPNEKGYIYAYITSLVPDDDGVDDVVIVDPIGPDELFAELKKNVLDTKCLRCHRNFGDQEVVKDYIVPKDIENSELYERVLTGNMPRRAAPLNATELKYFEDYINSL